MSQKTKYQWQDVDWSKSSTEIAKDLGTNAAMVANYRTRHAKPEYKPETNQAKAAQKAMLKKRDELNQTIMNYLLKHPDSNQTQIALGLGKRKTYFNGKLLGLCNQGLLIRHRIDNHPYRYRVNKDG